MARLRLPTLLHNVCRIIDPAPSAAADGQLLERFLRDRDEAAFELLVWRHGPMVLSVCRRVLQDPHLAEDAFQATFLTLVRKAGSIGKRGSVSSWLYKVAYRTALRARARAARRATCERSVETLPAAAGGDAPPDRAARQELRQVLDAEVHRLPEKYRAPFVLCYLEGKTNEEAAEELGCPKGTILSRLARARERLRNRLVRRGLALSAVPIAFLTAEHAQALLKVSPVLVNGTVHLGLLWGLGRLGIERIPEAVAGLSDGVIREMQLGWLKPAAAALTLAALLAGTSLWAFAGKGPEPALPPELTGSDTVIPPCQCDRMDLVHEPARP